jgi:hypothetical protein
MGMTGTAIEDIVQIGLVVRDAAATALQYRKMLGV